MDIKIQTGAGGAPGAGSAPVPLPQANELQAVKMLNADELRKAEMRGTNVSISDEQLIKAIDRAIKAMQGNNTFLEFSVHSGTKAIMVKVLEQDTGRIIREIPPEKMQDFIARLWELAGILVDERR